MLEAKFRSGVMMGWVVWSGGRGWGGWVRAEESRCQDLEERVDVWKGITRLEHDIIHSFTWTFAHPRTYSLSVPIADLSGSEV